MKIHKKGLVGLHKNCIYNCKYTKNHRKTTIMSEISPSTSKSFRNLSLIICFLCVFGAAFYLFQGFLGGLSIGVSSETGPHITTGLDVEIRAWRERAALIPFHLSVILTLLYGGATFWELSKGNIFTDRSVRLFRSLAFWMFMIALAGMFSGVILYMLMATSGQAVENTLRIEMSAGDFVTLGLSGMVYAFALILREAKRYVDDVRLIF